jgi:hypothetical protein
MNPPNTDKTDTAVDEEAIAKRWLGEMDQAYKREDKWRTECKRLTKTYEAKDDAHPFNILYSNTETLAPALYNNTPRPVVKPRYRDGDPNPVLASALTAAYLEFFIDSGDQEEASFDDLMLSALHESLITDRGVTRFKYDSDVEKDAEGKPAKVKSEYVCGEHVPHDRIRFGYAQRWSQVPWIAFEHYLTKDEAKALIGSDVEHLAIHSSADENGTTKIADSQGVDLVLIYEVWDKEKRRVFFLPESGKKLYKETSDPLRYKGFYPIPRPLSFVTKLSSMCPVTLYSFYQEQAEELNICTRRIKAVVAAIKASGFYNGSIEGLDRVLENDDGKMEPIKGLEGMGDGAKLDSAIWMWPSDKLVVVLQQLIQQRQLIKQTIYEITGLSDILRGATVASETATAQQLKNQWGSLRIKKFQKEIQRYVKDALRLVAAISFAKLGPDTIAASTGTKLPRQVQRDKARLELQALQEQIQAAQLMAPPDGGAGPGMGMEGPAAPPPPPEIPPDLQALASSPSLEEIVQLLAKDITRSYLIDIETNSTVDAEATEDKTNLAEFLTAVSQFLGGIGPMVENGTMPFEAAKKMLVTISRKFRMGRELEEYLDQMTQPQPQGGEEMKEVEKAKEELKKEREKFLADQQKHKEQVMKDKADLQMQAMKQKMQKMMDDLQLQMKDTKMKADMELFRGEMENFFTVQSTQYETQKQVDDVQRNAENQVRDVQTQTQQATFSAKEDGKRKQFEAKQAAKAKPAKEKA